MLVLHLLEFQSEFVLWVAQQQFRGRTPRRTEKPWPPRALATIVWDISLWVRPSEVFSGLQSHYLKAGSLDARAPGHLPEKLKDTEVVASASTVID